MFFGDCPAATLGRRLTAIDAAHRAAGVALPERTGQVRDVLRGRPARPVRQELDSAQVEAALRRLPSHGWINGWFGRRDRALLVLAGAGVPYRRIAALTAGDITVTDAVATINTTIRSVTLHPDDDPVLRGPCALVRWLRALHLAPTSPATRHPPPAPWPWRSTAPPRWTGRRRICAEAAAPSLRGSGMFRCCRRSTPAAIWRSTPGRCPRTRCPIWRAATPPVRARSTASTRKPPTNRSYRRRPRRRSFHRQRLTVGDWEQAVARRRADQAYLRGVDRALDETDRKAADLNRSILALLAARRHP
jgi:hypothetical protein